MCFCLLADMIFLLDPNNFLMITKKSTSHDALRIVLVDFLVPSRVMRKFVCRLRLNEVSQQ